MSLLPGPSNPIAYAQFHLSGGWKSNSIVAGLFGGVMVLVIYLTQLETHPQSAFAMQRSMQTIGNWASGLLIIETLMLLLLGTFRVGAAVRSDVSSRIIESHRLMPASAVGAVFGYVFVGPVLWVLLSVTATVVGLGCCLIVGADAGRYLLCSGLVGVTALFLWSMTARFAFDARGASLIVLIAGGVLVSNDGVLTALLPAVQVLTCPIVGNAVYWTRLMGPLPAREYLFSVLAQAAVAAVFIAAAARRYRSDESVGFSSLLGLLLVGLWVVLTILGCSQDLQFSVRRNGFVRPGEATLIERFVASVTVAMVLAAVPIAAAARSSALWFRRGPTPSMPVRPLPAFVVSAAVLLVIGSLLCIPRSDHRAFFEEALAHRVWFTAVTLGLFLTGITCVLQWVYLFSNRAIVVCVVWFILTWLVPPMLAAAMEATRPGEYFNLLMSASPVGMIGLLWQPILPPDLTGGLIAQAVLVAIPVTLLLTRMTRAVRRRNAAAMPVQTVVSSEGPFSPA
jgi:hypothetical protein